MWLNFFPSMDAALEAIFKLKEALEELGETRSVVIRVYDRPGLISLRTDSVRRGTSLPDFVFELASNVQRIHTELFCTLKNPFSDTAGPCYFVLDCSFGPEQYQSCKATWGLEETPGEPLVYHNIDMVTGEKEWELITAPGKCIVSTGKQETDDLVLHNEFDFASPTPAKVEQMWSRLLTLLPPEVADVITKTPTKDSKVQFCREHKHPLMQEVLAQLQAFAATVREKEDTDLVEIVLTPDKHYLTTDAGLSHDWLGALQEMPKKLSTLGLVKDVQVDLSTAIVYFKSNAKGTDARAIWKYQISSLHEAQVCMITGMHWHSTELVRVGYHPKSGHGVAEIDKDASDRDLHPYQITLMWSNLLPHLPEFIVSSLLTVPVKFGEQVEFTFTL